MNSDNKQPKTDHTCIQVAELCLFTQGDAGVKDVIVEKSKQCMYCREKVAGVFADPPEDIPGFDPTSFPRASKLDAGIKLLKHRLWLLLFFLFMGTSFIDSDHFIQHLILSIFCGLRYLLKVIRFSVSPTGESTQGRRRRFRIERLEKK